MTSEKPFVPCDGCSGHDCDDGCAYPGVNEAVSVGAKNAPTERTPEQIIGYDAYIQVIFEGYQIIRSTPSSDTLAGLKRYDTPYDFNGNPGAGMVPVEDGEYVLYSEASKIVAAKDAEIDQMVGVASDQVSRAEAAEAELEQIKGQERVTQQQVGELAERMQDDIEYWKSKLHASQEAVAYRYRFIQELDTGWSDWFLVLDTKSIPQRPTGQQEIQPLFTAPVSDSLKAEQDND